MCKCRQVDLHPYQKMHAGHRVFTAVLGSRVGLRMTEPQSCYFRLLHEMYFCRAGYSAGEDVAVAAKVQERVAPGDTKG